MTQPSTPSSLRFFKPLVLVLLLAPWISVSSGCSSSTNAPSGELNAPSGELGASSGLISGLIGAVPDLSQQQAIAAAGALFSLAQTNMEADQFAMLVEAVPGTNVLISRATEAGLPTSPSSMSAVTPFLSEQGITPDQVSQLVPALSAQVESEASDELASAFTAAIQ